MEQLRNIDNQSLQTIKIPIFDIFQDIEDFFDIQIVCTIAHKMAELRKSLFKNNVKRKHICRAVSTGKTS